MSPTRWDAYSCCSEWGYFARILYPCFAGGYQDATGLYHFAARYYDPNIGRFTTSGPSGQEKNPYLYAEGDPVNRIDPTGLLSLGGLVDKVGTAFDIAGVVGDFASGNTKAGFAGLTGMAAGALVGATCGATAAAFGVSPPAALAWRSESAATQRRNSGVMPPKTSSTGNSGSGGSS
ncbi:RHS repeat-associated core domain-containing protein [Streptomyces sp. NPDC089173]|uniref:RHS repeat-associated core domain-containing protein n=1 Tax=Streptomyces sp. NPDC089173 TaxID=3154965 RepID=UPI00344B386B